MSIIDTSSWHEITVKIPFPSVENAEIVQRVISVDPLLRPTESTRTLTVEETTLILFVHDFGDDFNFLWLYSDSIILRSMKSRTVAQARVGLDHTLSDIQLVVETIRKLGPGEQIGTGDSDTMEVGLNGSWEGGNK